MGQLTATTTNRREAQQGAARMAYVCALMAAHGLPSPYGGPGWADGADRHAADALMGACLALVGVPA